VRLLGIEDHMAASVTRFKEDASARQSQPAWLWAVLLCGAGLPRIWLALMLANPDGDAYAYLETIERMRASLAAGSLSAKTLYSFWLPMYQLICALISLFVNHPVYVAKLVSAVCGTGVCVLVFLITLRLTADRMIALAAALLVALNPLHALYSAFSLTEIPHALVVLGSLYAAITGRWAAAAICAAIAGFMRVESWMLIALLPALQLFAGRRLSIKWCGLLLVAPLLWLYVCWAATGDYLAYFHERSRYVHDIVAAYPHLQTMSLARLWQNGYSLLHSANPVVMLGCVVGTGLLIRQRRAAGRRDDSQNLAAVVAVAVFFFAYLSFLVAAFLTGNQPDIWDRYGLIFLANGVPLAAWTYLKITGGKPRLAVALAAMVFVVCMRETYSQMKDGGEIVRRTSPQLIIANKLQDLYQLNASIRILCDDGVIARLSEIPPQRFIASADLPAAPEAILADLSKRGVDYIIYRRDDEGSPMSRLIELEDGSPSAHFQLVVPAFATDWHGRVYLYRLRRPEQQSEK
jgi:Dolichyl-phosphate-mannose-protein mannosyltransferase